VNSKDRHLCLLATICLFTPLLTQTVSAQNNAKPSAVIPFDFWVAGTHMAAGEYTLDSEIPTLVLIRSLRGGPVAQVYLIPTNDRTNAIPGNNQVRNDPKLVFTLRNHRYVFTAIWTPDGEQVVSSEFGSPASAEQQTRDISISYSGVTVTPVAATEN